jgi:hypothetical protein
MNTGGLQQLQRSASPSQAREANDERAKTVIIDFRYGREIKNDIDRRCFSKV